MIKTTALVIGFDTRACDLTSSLAARLCEYGQHADMHVHVVVPARERTKVQADGYTAESIVIGNKAITWYRLLARAWEIVFDPSEHVRIITTRDPYMLGYALSLLARFARVGFELQFHGLEKRSRVRLFFARLTVRRADVVRVVTLRFRDELRNMFGIDKHKCYVAPVPVDVAHVTAHPPEVVLANIHKSGIVLAVGRLVEGKRFDALIRAWATLKKEGNTSHLVIVGEGPEDQRLLGLAHALGYGADFHLAGLVEDVRPYYHAASLVVHPSRHEGYGLVPIEAALIGTPLIMTDTGVAREVIPESDRVRIVPSHNDELLLQSMRTFFAGEWGKGRSARPLVAANVFTQEASAEAIAQAWKRAAGQDGTRAIRDYYNALVGSAYKGDYERERWLKNPIDRDRFMMMTEAIAKAFHHLAPERIFELGPGPGTWTALLAERFPRANFFLLDISSTMREQFIARRGEWKHVTYEIGDILEFTTRDRFDAVFSSRAIEYIPDKQNVINNLLTLLVPGGHGVLITKTPHYLKKKLLRQGTPWQHREQIHPLALKQLIEKCGGTNVTITIAVAYVPVFGRVLAVNRFAYKVLRLLPWSPLSSALSEAYCVRFQKPYAR